MHKWRSYPSFKCWSQGRLHRIDVKADAWRMSSISRGMSWGRDFQIKGAWWMQMSRCAAMWSDRVTKISQWPLEYRACIKGKLVWDELDGWAGAKEERALNPMPQGGEVFSTCHEPMKDFAQNICMTQFLFQESNFKAHVMSDLRGPGLVAGE